jgi:hypothetical protein
MMEVAQVAVCSQVNTKHINTVWAEQTMLELVHRVTSRLLKVKMDIQEVECGGMDWIELAEDMDR